MKQPLAQLGRGADETMIAYDTALGPESRRMRAYYCNFRQPLDPFVRLPGEMIAPGNIVPLSPRAPE